MYSSNINNLFAGLPLHNNVELIKGIKGIKGLPSKRRPIYSGRGGIIHHDRYDDYGYDDRHHGSDRHMMI